MPENSRRALAERPRDRCRRYIILPIEFTWADRLLIRARRRRRRLSATYNTASAGESAQRFLRFPLIFLRNAFDDARCITSPLFSLDADTSFLRPRGHDFQRMLAAAAILRRFAAASSAASAAAYQFASAIPYAAPASLFFFAFARDDAARRALLAGIF